MPEATRPPGEGVRPEFLVALQAAVDEDGVSVDPSDLEHYGRDRTPEAPKPRPVAVVRPAAVDQVAEVVRLCETHGVALVPSGGRTGLAGGACAPAGEVVLSLSRMRCVGPVDPEARTVRCQAGATIAEVDAAARSCGLFYPVEFAAQGSAQVGGTIATNAGGVRVVRYGPTRAWVRGLTVVVGGGRVLRLGRGLVKDNTGYALEQLFVGAEGTLGVVVEAVLGLAVPPAVRGTALVAAGGVGPLLALFQRLQRKKLEIGAFECFDAACMAAVLAARGGGGTPLGSGSAFYGLVEVEGRDPSKAQALADRLACVLCEAQEAGEIDDATIAPDARKARVLWSLRESISEALAPMRPHKADVTVPQGALEPFVETYRDLVARLYPGARPRIFGHIGDGNLHLNLLAPEGTAADPDRLTAVDDAVYREVERLGGSISAEHGIGLLKRPYLRLRRSEEELALMRRVKAVFDPAGIFNPGKLFP